jgi:hypothetical protein
MEVKPEERALFQDPNDKPVSVLLERPGAARRTGYFNPPLTIDERRIASLEGWILGVG